MQPVNMYQWQTPHHFPEHFVVVLTNGLAELYTD